MYLKICYIRIFAHTHTYIRFSQGFIYSHISLNFYSLKEKEHLRLKWISFISTYGKWIILKIKINSIHLLVTLSKIPRNRNVLHRCQCDKLGKSIWSKIQVDRQPAQRHTTGVGAKRGSGNLFLSKQIKRRFTDR